MSDLLLKNIRVIDHTIAWAGPQGTLILADMGAEVIKVESCTRPDVMRGGGRIHGPIDKFWEMGPWFVQLNRNKLAITIDLNREEGKELYLKLVRISDVVIDNFTPRVMPNLGLDYDTLRKANPEIIVAHLPGYGSVGPYRDAPAYGDCINAFSGLDSITGYPDNPTQRAGIAYGDPTSGFAAALAVLAAIHHRWRTSKGQLIDVSHFEITSKAMDGLLDYAINGRVQKPVANKDPCFAPQGCYPCQGCDQWVVITIASNDEWVKFGQLLDNPEWSQDSRFATVEGRWEYHEELDRLIAAWTCCYERYEVMSLLQKAGIASAPVLCPDELLRDAHFTERGFFEESVHTYTGTKLLPGMLFKLSATPGRTRLPAPLFGEHNKYVFQELLGLSDQEMQELMEKGLIGTEPLYG